MVMSVAHLSQQRANAHHVAINNILIANPTGPYVSPLISIMLVGKGGVQNVKLRLVHWA